MDENLSKKSPEKSSDSVSFSRHRSPLSNVWNEIVSLFSNRTTAVIGVLVLVLGIGAGIIAVQRSTEFRQRASGPSTASPGTCLILPQEFCATGKVVTNPDGTFKGIGFDLPDNTPVFAYDRGVMVSSFTTVGTSTYQGISLDPAGQTAGAVVTVNTYFKDSAGDSYLSKDVAKGQVLGYTHKDPQNPYDLLVNFARQGNNTINIDQALTEGNFK